MSTLEVVELVKAEYVVQQSLSNSFDLDTCLLTAAVTSIICNKEKINVFILFVVIFFPLILSNVSMT